MLLVFEEIFLLYLSVLFILVRLFPDGAMEWEEEMAYPAYRYSRPAEDDAMDFDYLLHQAQQKLHHRR